MCVPLIDVRSLLLPLQTLDNLKFVSPRATNSLDSGLQQLLCLLINCSCGNRFLCTVSIYIQCNTFVLKSQTVLHFFWVLYCFNVIQSFSKIQHPVY